MALEGSIDLFVLMVDYVAGGIFLSLLIWGLILLITGIMGRLSMQSILVILICYFSTAMIGYFGAIGALPFFIWGFWYMLTGIINKLSEVR